MASEVMQWFAHLKSVTILISIAAPSILLLYVFGRVFYNLFLHPLCSYPGPLLWRATQLPYDWHAFNGTLHGQIVKLHKRYGPVVRLNPTELSFTSSQARKDILAHFPGREEFPKDLSRVAKPPNGFESILLSHKENHARFRRLLSHAFSEKGLRDQEVHIRRHVDLLISNLTKRAEANENVDMVDWFNMATFDVIGNLAFGASFNCLEDGGKLHDWIPGVSGNVKFAVQDAILKGWGLGSLSKYIMDDETKKARIKNYMYAQRKVNERMEYGADRGDFWDKIITKSEKNKLTGEGMNGHEILNNAVVLVLGGSETSATTLSGATRLLLEHPDKLQRVVKEIRSSFASTEDITIHTVHKLEYMSAILEETMRLYPPVPQQTVRISPQAGGKVLGNFVPVGTVLNAHQLASNRVDWNFHRPDDFVPERWLPNIDLKSEFAGDDRAACQPFSLGTRNCIGKNLAYAEMRLILAKVLYHFDLSPGDGLEGDWFEQKAWAIRWKKPVWVRLRAVGR